MDNSDIGQLEEWCKECTYGNGEAAGCLLHGRKPKRRDHIPAMCYRQFGAKEFKLKKVEE